MTGTVVWLDHVKGYGWIKPDDGGADLYTHVSQTMDKVNAEERVYFDVFQGKRSPMAINVRRIK